MDLEIEITGPDFGGTIGRQRERSHSQFHRADPQNEVVHDWIPDQGHLEDVLPVDPGVGGELPDQFVDRLSHHPGHLGLTTGVHHHVGHPAHQIFAEADLRIHHAGAGFHFTAGEITQMGGHSRRAHIHRHPLDTFLELRPDRDNLPAPANRNRHLPLPLAALDQRALAGAHELRLERARLGAHHGLDRDELYPVVALEGRVAGLRSET